MARERQTTEGATPSGREAVSGWVISTAPRAHKDFRRVPPEQQSEIVAALAELEAGGPALDDFRETAWSYKTAHWRVRYKPDYRNRIVIILRFLPR